MVDLSISIVNTSNWIYLEPCLKAIIENIRDITYEILVVDNASDDGSTDKIKKEFPNVILTTNNQRFGFAKNNNLNLQKSSGRYSMLLNDDTLVQMNSLERAVKFLDDHKDVGVVGCEMINPDGSFQITSARRFRTLQSVFFSELGFSRKFEYHPFFDRISIKPQGQPIEIDLPQESGMIVRREVIEEVGLLDEDFFMFGEGADWCRRIKGAGWKIVFLPRTPIIHYGGATNKKASLRMYLQHYKSTYLFFRKKGILLSFIYKAMIIIIYGLKYVFTRWKGLFTLNKKIPPSTHITYYGALIKLMIYQLEDPTYPYPVHA